MTDFDNVIKIITVCYNTSNYILELQKSISKTIGRPYKLIVVDNGSSLDHLTILKSAANKNPHNWEILRRIQVDIHAPSRHHGEAINFGIKNLNNDDMAVVVDCDSCFILKNWGKKISSLLKKYAHVTCVRPNIEDLDCGAWFSAFYVKTIKDNNISFLPMLHDDGRDMRMINKYDVGSDLMRISPWRQIHAHPDVRFNKRGHIWMLDESPFIDHMGNCTNSKEFEKWKLWIKNAWLYKLSTINKYKN